LDALDDETVELGKRFHAQDGRITNELDEF